MLAQAITRVFDELERVLRITLKSLPFSESSAQQRQEILRAIRDRDPVAARAAMSARTQTLQDQIIDQLVSHASLAEISISIT